jgi:hypothetical protein
MVDRRSEADFSGLSGSWEGGAFVLLVRARFVLAAAVAVAAVGLGFSVGESKDARDLAVRNVRELRLDPNTVPPEVLTALPHVGAGLVDRWVKAREERPFRSPEDARARVRGLGVATLAQIAPYFEFPESGRLTVTTPSARPVRPASRSRIARRQKSGTGDAATSRQPRLAAQFELSGDR